jgi:hypothetical protein
MKEILGNESSSEQPEIEKGTIIADVVSQSQRVASLQVVIS